MHLYSFLLVFLFCSETLSYSKSYSGEIRCLVGRELSCSSYAFRLPAIATATENVQAEPFIFGGVKFGAPLSGSLRNMGIEEPSPIQAASLVAINSGLSCILHAETGSGKTFAYLLPLMKRIYSNGRDNMQPLQAMIVVPTKELAVQVAADVASLASGGNMVTAADCSLVHLCISSSKSGFDKVSSPVIIGTPFKLLECVLASSPSTIEPLSYLVLDEVDRLINSLGKYSTSDDRRSARENEKPVEELLSVLVKLKGVLGRDHSGTNDAMQVIAASATVGRALRRELYRLLEGRKSSARENESIDAGKKPFQGELLVLRAAEVATPDVAISLKSAEKKVRSGAKSAVDSADDEADEEEGAGKEEEKAGRTTRRVGIPLRITHRALLVRDDSNELNTKLAAAKKLWITATSAAAATQDIGHRGLLFVPSSDDMTQVLGMLKFWGVTEATNLQQVLGIDDSRPARFNPGVKRYKVPGQKNDAVNEKSGVSGDSPVGGKKLSSQEMVLLAARSKIGSSGKLTPSEPSPSHPNPAQENSPKNELFVVPVSGTRGLHIQDVEYVYVLRPPRSMDEYVHMAGRTGRAGSIVPGTVITLVNYDELLRLQSWQTPLGITFEVEYER